MAPAAHLDAEVAEPLVRTDVAGGVATIMLTSPGNRNALSRRLLVELAGALDRTAEDPAVRVVVLTGADPVFCAGADLKEQQDGLGPGPVSMPDVVARIMDHSRPVVARVNGAARAGGLGLVAACDIAIGLRSSTFAFSEVRIGVVPAIISIPVLQRMNLTAAHAYFLTGDTFGGDEAAATGLLNLAADDGMLDMEVTRVVESLAKGGPKALAATKQLRKLAVDLVTTDNFAAMQELSTKHFTSSEGQEGISAFREKRPAAWTV